MIDSYRPNLAIINEEEESSFKKGTLKSRQEENFNDDMDERSNQ